MLNMLYPERRHVAPSAVVLMATEVLVEDALAVGRLSDDEGVNEFWFFTKEHLSVHGAINILVGRGLATFEGITGI